MESIKTFVFIKAKERGRTTDMKICYEKQLAFILI